MGYTHYWSKNTEGPIPKEALELVQDILDRHAELVQREYDDDRPPVVTSEYIQFNGIEDESHETFFFEPGSNEPCSWFCKTSRKPYDLPVCEVLIVLDHFMTIGLRSDGFEEDGPPHDENWDEAADNVLKHYKIKWGGP